MSSELIVGVALILGLAVVGYFVLWYLAHRYFLPDDDDKWRKWP